MFFANIITQVPQWLVEPGIAQSVLDSEFRGAINRRAAETLDRLRSVTIVFRGNTRRAWRRTVAKRFGNSFAVTFENPEVTAAVLEFGAPDRFRGSPGFSRPPPIKSAVAGAGRTIFDWVQEVDPVFVDEIAQQLEQGRANRTAPVDDLVPIPELAARKAAYQISKAIFNRGLPSQSNRNLLLSFSRELERQADALRDEDLPAAIQRAFELLGRNTVEVRR